MCIRDSENDAALAAMRASGTTAFHDLSPEERAAWLAALLPVQEAMAGRIGAQTLAAVSYTHLDVYKRQEAMLPSPCIQNHAANLCRLPDGALACVWFGGTMEGMGDISVWMSRLEPGAEGWSAAERLTDAPDRSEQNPVLFLSLIHI